MAISTIPTTELEAVNRIISTIGEAPVSTLSDNTTVEVVMAQNFLSDANREVQKKGWHFNTEKDVPLTRDGNNKIPLPANAMKVDVDPALNTDIDPVIRGSFLYDVKNRTDVFKKDLKAEIVYLLTFTDLPEAARHYISILAARRFQRYYGGDEQTERFSQAGELIAWRDLDDDDSKSADYSIFDSPETAAILKGRSPLRYS